MKLDHKIDWWLVERIAKTNLLPPLGGTNEELISRALLDAMARLDKATELLRRAEAFAGSCMSWKRGAGELESDIAAFLERKTDDR